MAYVLSGMQLFLFGFALGINIGVILMCVILYLKTKKGDE